MPDELKIRFAQQMHDVGLLAGEKIVDADDIVPLLNQSIAQMRPDKTSPASHDNALECIRHSHIKFIGQLMQCLFQKHKYGSRIDTNSHQSTRIKASEIFYFDW